MQIDIELMLPREVASVPVIRHLCGHAMREIGVEDECCDDVELAVTEACTNVLRHSGPGDDYRVAVEIDGERCTIRVRDRGHGFDFSSLGRPDVAATAEGGRGVALIRALVDRVEFESKPEAGTIVRLEKDLRFARPALPGSGAR